MIWHNQDETSRILNERNTSINCLQKITDYAADSFSSDIGYRVPQSQSQIIGSAVA